MKKLAVFIGLMLTLGISGLGQKQKTQSVGDTDSGSRSSGRSVVLDSGTRIEGELQSTVDVKRSQVGDQVVLKTTKALKQDGQTIVPKGSRLIGRVTEVQEKTKSNGASRVGLIFDRLEGKELAMPIDASIVSITNAAANARAADLASADVFGSSNTSARSSGGSSAGGGLLGGVGNAVGGVTGTAGAILGGTTQTVGSVTGSAANTVGSTAGVVRTINGIQITSSASGSAQSGSTLSAANRNIRLEKGTTLGLQLNSSTTVQ